MEVLLRAALLAWLAGSPEMSAMVSTITEEKPARPTLPWLSIASSAAIDWSTKTEVGQEVRIALELQCRGDLPDAAASLVTAIDAHVRSLPAAQTGFAIVGRQFMRSRSEQRSPTTRAILMEYRFRTQSN